MQVLKNKSELMKLFFAGVIGLFLTSCGGGGETTDKQSKTAAPKVESKEAAATPADPMESKGVGPIKELHLEAIDQAMAAEGKVLFEDNCSACHKIDARYVGPAVAGVTSRRTPEWIMNMILNPEQMVKEDPTAKALLAEYLAPMANQNLTEDQARKILEYFRTIE